MNIKKIEKYIKDSYHNSSDLVIRKIKVKNKDIIYFFLESVSSDDKISDFFMKDVSSYVKSKKIIVKNLFEFLENSIPNSHMIIENDIKEVFYRLAGGYTIIFTEDSEEYICIETKAKLDRGVSESTSETIIRGPKDSFTENNSINLGLIRKRIKDQNLWFDEIIVGRRSKTKVTISYISDIAEEKKINEIKKIINKIDIDGIVDSGYLKDFLNKSDHTVFPKIKSTERPDLASTALLEGKIVILVENSPFVLITPSTLVDYVHASEDYYQKTANINLTRMIRAISFFLTIITPALYVALTTYNQEMIPNELLISLAVQREGVPFPTAFEVLMMIFTFEILRESDIRLPSTMGAAISIVGALVLGEAAVSAGIVSPIVIIVVAITSISGLLFTDIDFVNAIRWWRFIFLFFATISGLIGIVIAGILFTTKLSSIVTNGTPYLAPFSPLNIVGLKDSIIRVPINKLKKRPSYITQKDQTKLGDANE